MEHALAAVEYALVAVGGVVHWLDGHTLDAIEDGTLAVEGIANLLGPGHTTAELTATATVTF